jgi:hypothetical protein
LFVYQSKIKNRARKNLPLGYAGENDKFAATIRLRSTMDSIRVSEAPDPGSIPGEATSIIFLRPYLQSKSGDNFAALALNE